MEVLTTHFLLTKNLRWCTLERCLVVCALVIFCSHECFIHSFDVNLFLHRYQLCVNTASTFSWTAQFADQTYAAWQTASTYIFGQRVYTRLGSLTRSFFMKSLHPAVMASNSSAAKSYSTFKMFDIVSLSLSPWNGDKPDTLKFRNTAVTVMLNCRQWRGGLCNKWITRRNRWLQYSTCLWPVSRPQS